MGAHCDASPGDEVRQTRLLAELPDLFRAFGLEWVQRWGKHADVDPAKWDSVIAGLRGLAHGKCMQIAPIDATAWRQAVSRKPARTSSGPDGVSRLDLSLLPDDLLEALLGIVHHAEATGEWPKQALTGIVVALEKKLHACEVKDFRPITVLSIFLRTWSSIRARQCLQFISSLAPDLMFGNLPGVTAASLWYSVQALVERASYGDQQQLGFSADLVKAFNLLPRVPVLAAARVVGIDPSITRAWAGALHGLERRFRIRGSTGPPIRSVTGFAEGCGMSCVAMAITNLALHAHVKERVPTSGLATFVDNYAGVCSSPEDLTATYSAVQGFVEAWDLQLDEGKTVAWATDPVHRRALRSGGFCTILQGRDLGAHMQFSRRCTNATVVSRIQALEPLWSQLRWSFAPFRQKVFALSTAAWPRAFYGVANVHLGSAHYCRLRAGAMRGLSLDRPGAHAAIQLSLCLGPRFDPEYVAIRQTFLDARLHLHPDAACEVLGWALATKGRPPGPVGVLLARASFLGWQWLADSCLFRDQIGDFCLWGVGPQELELRLSLAWQHCVAAMAAHRPDFGGLERADPLLTRRCQRECGPRHCSTLTISLNGSFYTQDKLCHCEESSVPLCRFCGQPDSLDHRIWRCEVFAASRATVAQAGLPDVSSLPPCQALHGWAMRPARILELWTMLDALPRRLPPFQAVPLRAVYDLFTDGTCMLPSVPQLRLAAWGVTLARHDPSCPSMAVCSGVLPGLVQTSFRAEIYAFLAAASFAASQQVQARIWTDCQGVLRKVQGLLQGVWKPATCSANSDLWLRVKEVLDEVRAPLTIHKVTAHEAHETASNVVEAWAFLNNGDADALASRANMERCPAFQAVWDDVRRDFAYQGLTARATLQVHATVASQAVRLGKGQGLASPDSSQPTEEEAVQFPEAPDKHVPKLWAKYDRPYVEALYDWMQAALVGPAVENEPIRWVSVVHLLYSFFDYAGLVPPWFDARTKRWQSLGQMVRPEVVRPQVGVLSAAFCRHLRECVQAQGGVWSTADRRPYSSALQIKVRSLACRFPLSQLEAVDARLIRLLPGGVCGGRSISWKSLRLC